MTQQSCWQRQQTKIIRFLRKKNIKQHNNLQRFNTFDIQQPANDNDTQHTDNTPIVEARP